MPQRRHGDGGRVEGEDDARARFLTAWSTARRPGMKVDDVPAEVFQASLERARSESPAITHPSCCWCSRCVAAARVQGDWPLDEALCERLHHDGVHV
ncbi:hypothetical protein ACFPK1_18905 [Actinomycetospora rhizophila]|uniref:Uncharacterized protein n=1 Tax=Actinomycetospora rhizophila TaxID=1416876 RepID=A0ABV9ZGM4_9PSEU